MDATDNYEGPGIYIIIAGIKRSGSTWQANVVREIYTQLGADVWIGEEFGGKLQAEVTINKIHPYREHLAKRADYVLTSWRNIFDILESFQRFKGYQPSKELIQAWLTWLLEWNRHACHMTLYPALESRVTRLDEIKTISQKIAWGERLEVRDFADICERMENLSPPDNQQYDPETLLFRNHITS